MTASKAPCDATLKLSNPPPPAVRGIAPLMHLTPPPVKPTWAAAAAAAAAADGAADGAHQGFVL